MDLKTYIESEIEEDRQRGLAPRTHVSTGGYPGDPDVHVAESEVDTERSTVPLAGERAEQLVYVARPRGDARAPAVVVIHENKGLVPYVENVVRRLAREGYVAVAPDLLSRVGGTASFAEPAEVTAALSGIPAADVVADVRSVVDWLAARPDVTADRIGMTGFCYGGGVTWRVLTQEPRLRVGIPFYGPIPDLDAVPAITAPVLAVYAEQDERITSMLPAIREAMARHGKTFEALVVDGAQHAFHNDTNPDRYDALAARLAWDRALGWLARWLR